MANVRNPVILSKSVGSFVDGGMLETERKAMLVYSIALSFLDESSRRPDYGDMSATNQVKKFGCAACLTKTRTQAEVPWGFNRTPLGEDRKRIGTQHDPTFNSETENLVIEKVRQGHMPAAEENVPYRPGQDWIFEQRRDNDWRDCSEQRMKVQRNNCSC
ncbi:hypothetical protein J6590_028699 [Homalodisca vitripennis]|nr:hypothetical protein J6590_028699 [Homalodisca vitripennis]